MAGIVFPNVANALLPLIQMDRQAEESRLNRERLEKHDQWLMEDRKEARSLQKQQSALQLDAAKRAQLKDAADATTQAAMGVLNTPEAERPAAYQQALQFLKSRGHDTGNLPPTYSPGMDGMLRFYVQKAESVTDFLKRQADTPQPMGPGGAQPSDAPAGDVMARAGNAIAGIESGGRYDATGPMTGGDRAYGKYQVMGANIPTWTQEALGRPMTPQEYLANPQAQDAVFKHKFGQYMQKYGPEGAAKAWFAGEGGMNNPNASDVLGTSVAGYAQKFNKGFGGPQVAQAGGPPVVPPQGDAVAGQGDVMAPPRADDPMAALRTMQLPPGVRFVGKQGIPMIQGDRVLIQMPDNSRQWVPMPAKKEAQAGPAGPFAGNNPDVQAFNYLVSTGKMTVEQAANVLGGKTVTNPADGSIVFMPASALAGAGAPQTPATPGAAAPPAGPSGSVQLTPPKPVQMTEGQSAAALYADRMENAEKTIAATERAALNPTGKILENVPFGNYLQPEDYQKFEQSRRDFINAVLRRESGAVISEEEFKNAEKQYFARPGDTESILKQKAENRRIAIEGIKRAAGPAYKKEQEGKPSAAPAAPTPKVRRYNPATGTLE